MCVAAIQMLKILQWLVVFSDSIMATEHVPVQAEDDT